jgi:hypothetical protein
LQDLAINTGLDGHHRKIELPVEDLNNN